MATQGLRGRTRASLALKFMWLRGLDLFKNVPGGRCEDRSKVGCGDLNRGLDRRLASVTTRNFFSFEFVTATALSKSQDLRNGSPTWPLMRAAKSDSGPVIRED